MSKPRQTGEAPVVLLLLSLGFGVVSVPFLLGNADSWDMVGHLSHAGMQRQMLPQLVFWNPHFFTGYEQFTAYPPLLSLLVALSSFVLGLTGAFKLVTVLSWLALPGSIYFFQRGLLPRRSAVLGTTLASLVLVLFPQQIGGTFFSTLVVGNVANALGLVFFTLALGFIVRDEYRRAAPLIALLVLSHMIAAVVLSVFIGAKWACERRGWSLLLGYGLAAFWLVPALLDTFRDISTHDDYPLTPVEYVLYVVVFVGYLAARRRRPDRKLDFLVLATGILFFLVGVLRFVAPSLWAALPMHFHRVKIYSLVVLVPLLVWMLPERIGALTAAAKRPVWTVVAAAGAVVLLIAGAFSQPLVFHRPWQAPVLAIEGDRVLTVERIPEVPYWHNFRHHLADRGHLVSKGLFIEASPDAPFLLSLEQMLDRDHQLPLRWGIDWSPRVMAAPNVIERIPFLLDVFGVQAVASDRPLTTAAGGVPGSSAGEYRVIERPHQSLVDVPIQPIKFSGRPSSAREWQALTRQWFLAGEDLLVIDGAPVAMARDGSARLAGEEKHFNVLDIVVEATEPAPVSIRMGYSSKWRAFSAAGELPVYRTTPNNMLVVAAEDFELRFEPLNRFNYLGLLITVLSLVGWYRLREPDPPPPAR